MLSIDSINHIFNISNIKDELKINFYNIYLKNHYKCNLLSETYSKDEFIKYKQQRYDKIKLFMNKLDDLNELLVLEYYITHLNFANKFYQPYDNLPNTLTHLTFGEEFNQPLNLIIFDKLIFFKLQTIIDSEIKINKNLKQLWIIKRDILKQPIFKIY